MINCGYTQTRSRWFDGHKWIRLPRPKRRHRSRRISPMDNLMCSICNERYATQKHHLIPKSYKKIRIKPKILVCRPCHKFIHRAFSISRLAMSYNTAKALRHAQEVQMFLRVYDTRMTKLERRIEINRILTISKSPVLAFPGQDSIRYQ